MHSTDTGAGQHGNWQLGNHLHIQAHSITFLYANTFQNIGKFLYFSQQFAISKGLIFFGVVALPDNGSLIPMTSFHVPVQTIIAYVQFRAIEPFYIALYKIKFPNSIPFFIPGNSIRNCGPKCIRIRHGFFI